MSPWITWPTFSSSVMRFNRDCTRCSAAGSAGSGQRGVGQIDGWGVALKAAVVTCWAPAEEAATNAIAVMRAAIRAPVAVHRLRQAVVPAAIFCISESPLRRLYGTPSSDDSDGHESVEESV